MKAASSLAVLFGLFLAGSSSLLLAAPAHQPPQPQHHGQAHKAPARQLPGHTPPPAVHQPIPPRDLAALRHAFRQRSGQIGHGPALPPGLRIERGKPLPKGYGKRLDVHALRGLPQYHGYEWQRVGRDLVLVKRSNGAVYAILDNVLG
ncbi:hypothetical protein [Zestomonas thermotolerans]|uniref:hypothetical protein n=1 Tax=Zestomonas thermotolerans TaxID=157784 RepID=UPI0023F18EB5|nr:hypothetical protein [Pseudomonas thermotolerans]MBO2509611.1 hypothetical protein [Gammaproteobacteria bacterium]